MLDLLLFPVALLFMLADVERYAVSSDSMAPGLVAGDVVTGSRAGLGFSRYSFASFRLPIAGRLFETPPRRGAIVSLRPPHQPESVWIERVIGLPGDTIRMTAGTLAINGTSVGLDDLGQYRPSSPADAGGTIQLETFPEGSSHSLLNLRDGSFGDDTGTFLVPPGHYFLMGDNRDNSNDSRFALGFVPAENLIAVIEPLR